LVQISSGANARFPPSPADPVIAASRTMNDCVSYDEKQLTACYRDNWCAAFSHTVKTSLTKAYINEDYDNEIRCLMKTTSIGQGSLEIIACCCRKIFKSQI